MLWKIGSAGHLRHQLATVRQLFRLRPARVACYPFVQWRKIGTFGIPGQPAETIKAGVDRAAVPSARIPQRLRQPPLVDPVRKRRRRKAAIVRGVRPRKLARWFEQSRPGGRRRHCNIRPRGNSTGKEIFWCSNLTFGGFCAGSETMNKINASSFEGWCNVNIGALVLDGVREVSNQKLLPLTTCRRGRPRHIVAFAAHV